jgi:hypothetical protein
VGESKRLVRKEQQPQFAAVPDDDSIYQEAKSVLSDNIQQREEHETRTRAGDELLSFVLGKKHSFDCSPVDFFVWCKRQHIMSIADLKEACDDEEFVEFELI